MSLILCGSVNKKKKCYQMKNTDQPTYMAMPSAYQYCRHGFDEDRTQHHHEIMIHGYPY